MDFRIIPTQPDQFIPEPKDSRSPWLTHWGVYKEPALVYPVNTTFADEGGQD